MIYCCQKLRSGSRIAWPIVIQNPRKRFERRWIEVVPRELGRCRHSGVFGRSQVDGNLDPIIPRILLKFAPFGQKDRESRSLPRVPWSIYEESMGARASFESGIRSGRRSLQWDSSRKTVLARCINLEETRGQSPCFLHEFFPRDRSPQRGIMR